jgi:hypothetical protein
LQAHLGAPEEDIVVVFVHQQADYWLLSICLLWKREVVGLILKVTLYWNCQSSFFRRYLKQEFWPFHRLKNFFEQHQVAEDVSLFLL